MNDQTTGSMETVFEKLKDLVKFFVYGDYIPLGSADDLKKFIEDGNDDVTSVRDVLTQADFAPGLAKGTVQVRQYGQLMIGQLYHFKITFHDPSNTKNHIISNVSAFAYRRGKGNIVWNIDKRKHKSWSYTPPGPQH